MKISKSQLRRIIKEALAAMVDEGMVDGEGKAPPGPWHDQGKVYELEEGEIDEEYSVEGLVEENREQLSSLLMEQWGYAPKKQRVDEIWPFGRRKKEAADRLDEAPEKKGVSTGNPQSKTVQLHALTNILGFSPADALKLLDQGETFDSLAKKDPDANAKIKAYQDKQRPPAVAADEPKPAAEPAAATAPEAAVDYGPSAVAKRQLAAMERVWLPAQADPAAGEQQRVVMDPMTIVASPEEPAPELSKRQKKLQRQMAAGEVGKATDPSYFENIPTSRRVLAPIPGEVWSPTFGVDPEEMRARVQQAIREKLSHILQKKSS